MELDDKEFDEIAMNIRENSKLFWVERGHMFIRNSILDCIKIKNPNKLILIMVDGFQYAKFDAIINALINMLFNKYKIKELRNYV